MRTLLNSLTLVLFLALSTVLSVGSAWAQSKVNITPDDTKAVAAAVAALQGQKAQNGAMLLPEVFNGLTVANVDPKRYRLVKPVVLQTEDLGDARHVVAGVVFADPLDRRLWMALSLNYQAQMGVIAVGQADAYWNSPFDPAVTVRLMPSGAVSDADLNTLPDADLLGAVVDRSIAASAIPPGTYDMAVIFHDRVPNDAEIALAFDGTAEGAYGLPLPAQRRNGQGWPVLIARGVSTALGIVKVIYTPGGDKPPEARTPRLIAAVSLR